MSLRKNHLLAWVIILSLVLGLALAGCSSPKPAQPAASEKKEPAKYPSKPVKLVVGRAAGSSTDLVARVVQPFLTKELGQPVVIENVATGAGKIADNQVYKADPDGYSLLIGNFPTEVLNQAVDDTLPYDITKFTPVFKYSGGTASTINVSLKSPIKTLDDLIAAGKKKKMIMSTMTGLANSPVSYALFAKATGVTMELVPYASGAEAITAMMGGHSEVSFGNSADIMDKHNKTLRTLAIFLPERHRDLPDVPAFAEKYPGISLENGIGILAPPNTPKEIVDVLVKAMEKICKDPEFAKAAGKTFDVKPLGPEAFAKDIKAQLENAKAIKPMLMQFVGNDQAAGAKK